MDHVAERRETTRHERVAWLLVGGGYALVVLATILSLVFDRFGAPGPGGGALIIFTLTMSALGLLILSATGSLIALWAVRSGVIPRRRSVLALLALGIVGVAVPGTFLATILMRGQ